MEQPLQVAIFGCGWASQRHAEAYKQCNAVITFLLEIEHFLHSIRTGQEPLTSGRSQRRSLEIVLAAYQSMKTGQPVVLS